MDPLIKRILCRLLGFGKLPKVVKAALKAEGIRILEERVRVSITYRNFRASGKFFPWKRRISLGAVAVTTRRLMAYAGRIRLVNVTFDVPSIGKLDITVECPNCLCIVFGPSDFNPGQSGQIECRFHTPQAEHIAKWIEQSGS